MRRHAFVVAAVSLVVAVCSSCNSGCSSGCKKTPAGRRACHGDGDCIIACESRESCCRAPYCESAEHAEDAREIREANEKRCTAADQRTCPEIGARIEPDYRVVPRCRASACVAEKVPK